jgi:hypothetical protein
MFIGSRRLLDLLESPKVYSNRTLDGQRARDTKKNLRSLNCFADGFRLFN